MLQKSREEFKDLFENAPVGFHEIDAEGRLVRINNTELKLLGYSAEELLGQFVWKISAEEATSRQAALAKLGGEPPSPQGFERSFRRKDGSTFPVWITDRLLKREDGVITGIRGTIQDITGRKQAEAALLDSEQRYRQLFDLASDAVVLVDSETRRYMDVNQATQRLYGYTREEFLQMGPENVSDEPEKTHDHIAAHDAHVPFRWHRKKNGERFAVEITANQILYRGRPTALVALRDITDRLRAETAVRESQALYHSLVDQMPAGIFRKDREGRYVFVNSWLCQFHNLTEDQFIGRTPEELAEAEAARGPKYPEILQSFRDGGKHHEKILRTGRPIHVEEVYSTASGAKRHLHVVKSAVFGPDGQITGTQGIQFDITERKRAEAELDRERDLWQTLLDTSPDHIYFKDTQSRFIKCSKAQARQFGVASPDELVGKTDFDFFTDEHARPAYEDEQAIIRTGVPIIAREEREVWKDGRVSWASSTKMPLRDATGNITGIMGISRDITERKLAEEQLRQLSSAVEHSPASIVITDPAGNIEYVNPKFTAVTGYSLAEVLGKNPRILKSGETPAEEYQRMWRAIASGGEWQGEFHNRKKNGELFWESASLSSILDGSGKVAHFVAVKEDITEFKLAREKLMEAFAFNQKIIADAAVGIIAFKASGRCVLANEAAARTLNGTVPRLLEQDFRQLKSWRESGMIQIAEAVLAKRESRQCEAHCVSAFGREVWLVCHFSHFVQNGEPHLLLIFNDVTEKKKLEAQFLRAQRMESIGTLAGGIAHDLNNVLTPLLFSIQILKEKISDDEGQQMLDTLESNVRRGASLVKQVLAFGRGVKGDRVLLQVKNIAREIEQIVQGTFPKSIQFRLESAPDLWTVSCDPTQIHQVLLNLCVNARDAMPDGGKLTLRLNNLALDAAQAAMDLDARPGPYVVINVEDTGTGIPKEIQERIFEPFFTTKDPGKGTGLGLSTTLAIVRSHGGFIRCYSTPGKGSIFKVYLPADVASAATEGAPAEYVQLPRGHQELVLVVDDEAPIREVARQILERFGYRVLLAVNGVEAVQLYTARQDEIAVVITDMAMPVMDGHATIAALRAMNPKVKIIGSSGLDMNDGNTKAIHDAIGHFIPKPYTVESMLDMLHEVLREYPAARNTSGAALPANRPAD